MVDSIRPTVSVVMATYNGERFLRPQLDSILPQLMPGDELLISDDGSRDATLSILREYAAKDDRITLLTGPGKGIIANFSFLLERAKGDVVFLCDQDDIWLPGKLERQLSFFSDDVWLVLSDAKLIDETGALIAPSFQRQKRGLPGVMGTVIRSGFIGCCMAVSRPLLKAALPIPKRAPMHDMWLGVVAEHMGKVLRLNEPLILYRRHSAAVTSARAPFSRQLKWRLELLLEYIKWRMK